MLADTERLAVELHETGPGARVQIAVAPCSPFSVTRRLMEESAELARRLGLPLHTHLAETVEEEAYCRGALRLPPGRVPRAARLARRGRLVRALRPPLGRRTSAAFADDGHRRRALPDLEPPARRGRRAGAGAARRGRAGRSRRRRLGVERAQRPALRGEAGAARRARARRAGGDDRARGASARHPRRRRRAAAATTSARSSPASAPTSPSGAPTASSSPARTTRSPRSSSRRRTASTGCTSAARRSSATARLVRADEEEIAREHRRSAARFA